MPFMMSRDDYKNGCDNTGNKSKIKIAKLKTVSLKKQIID